ncbi:tRNA pseudouridine(55) synthase TruB [Rubrimonas cliftonensis]|uniref:tRNA pseudouridine synthase B n=1 Tax=Rubrimonas cliftonensis TaxID=89524 RepID=A0A1H3YJQ8_9RHOB|nr:tRNA pseudouridine(55) synthase TruB [Rubrimonas cliftonensis]SEA11723.1 tRNA pseudouridine synthase B [Rubrimonas cliftonensis]
MARKGRRVDGWLVLDKPLGVSSAQAVAKARWAAQAVKAGHAGTLDPLATGVLAIAFGEATKTVSAIEGALKAYRFTVRLGQATATDDAEGEVTALSHARPSDAEIEAALPTFTGDILQTPPAYSAVKVDGRRAYALARAGEEVELGARALHVARLALVARPDADHAVLEMTCGKGGYVRSVARDLGETLGCLGHVVALRRVWSGPFHERDAIPFAKLDEIRHSDAIEAHLAPVATGLADIPALAVPAPDAASLRQGRAVSVAGGDLSDGDEAWAAHEGAPVALGSWSGGVFTPRRVFNP